MNCKELYEAVAEEMDVSVYKAEKVVKTIFGVIGKELISGGEVAVANFGKFKSFTRSERNGVNPTTSEKIVIPERKAVKFVPSSILKKEL